MKGKDVIRLTFREISYQQMSHKKLFNIEIIFVEPPSLVCLEELLFLLLWFASFVIFAIFVVFVIFVIFVGPPFLVCL